MPLAETMCDQCGPPMDDHPKVHVLGGGSWHHDCTPYAVKQQILDGEHSVDAAVTASVFEAAESGVHGDDLRAKIQSLHKGV